MCGLARIPLVAWVESTARDERPGRFVTELPKKMLAHSCTAFLVPGRASADYVRSLGIEADCIERAPNAVDTHVFGDAVAQARRELDRLRNELGLTRCTFLCVGRLDPEKGVDLLIEAIHSVAADLVVVGAGADAERLKRLAPPNVRFVGRLERESLVPWYAASDAFVLPPPRTSGGWC